MRKTSEVPFVKLHGLGNDFIVSDLGLGPARTPGLAVLRSLAKSICERHTGIGADGFLLVTPPRRKGNSARVRFFNADGSEAEMSGNGIRCAGAFLLRGSQQKRPLRIETMAGVKVLKLVKQSGREWEFCVVMGAPVLQPEEIPFIASSVSTPVVQYRLGTNHGELRVTVTSMGNPHCSIFVKNFEQMDWPAVGCEIELHRHFPNRTNVEFIRVISRREIEVRFWERGVGVTASSGTGSCAAAVAAVLNGLTDRQVRVKTVAGTLQVEWPEGGEVVLRGPAQWIAEGLFTVT